MSSNACDFATKLANWLVEEYSTVETTVDVVMTRMYRSDAPLAIQTLGALVQQAPQDPVWHTTFDGAVKAGRADIVRVILDRGAPVSIDDALITAAKVGHREVVETLLRAGADVNTPRKYYSFNTTNSILALVEAATEGRAEVARVLLDHGADVRARNNLPMFVAVSAGHTRVVKVLLEYGADVSADDDEPLREAAKWGYAGVVKVLLKHGANVHANGDQALRCAAKKGYVKVIKVLLEFGADAKSCADMAGELLSRGIDVVKLLHKHGAWYSDA